MTRRYAKKPGPGSGLAHIPLDQERIVQTALVMLNGSGLSGLSMRNLADALGVKAAALYWHVRNKDELLQLLADRICEEIHFPKCELTWQEKIRRFMFKYREVLLRYRDSAHVLAETAPVTPKRQKLISDVLETFTSIGFSQEEAVMAGSLLNNYVLGFVIDEVRLQDQTNAINFDDVADKAPTVMWEFPPMDKQFQFGLDTLLDGLQARLMGGEQSLDIVDES